MESNYYNLIQCKRSIKKSDDMLKAANDNLNTENYTVSISNSYYAMFWITKAYLILHDIKTKSHGGTSSELNRILFEKNQKKLYVRTLNTAYRKRLTADYEAAYTATEEEAKNNLEDARKYIKKIKIQIDTVTKEQGIDLNSIKIEEGKD